MALKLADRVKETSTTTGTGTLNLAGASTGYQTFVAGIGTGNTTIYCITDGTNWEIGIGTVTDATPDTLSRDTVLASSNAGAKVNWSAGTRDVFCCLPARLAGFIFSVEAHTSTHTIGVQDGGKLHTESGTYTVNLPAAATAGDGFAVGFVNIGSGVITLDGNSSETIDGQTTLVLHQGQSIWLACNGSSWRSALAGYRASGVSAHKNGSDQTGITNGVATKVTFGTERWDLQGEFASSTFTAQVAGIYRVCAQLTWNSLGSGFAGIVYVYVGGAEFTRSSNRSSGAGQTISVNVAVDVQLAAGGTIEIYGEHSDTGSTRDISGTATRTWVTIMRVG